jgi:hypothetical protein
MSAQPSNTLSAPYGDARPAFVRALILATILLAIDVVAIGSFGFAASLIAQAVR